MRLPMRKLNNFVLDRRAVTRPRAFNTSSVEWRPVKIRANYFMRPPGGLSYPARDLFHVERQPSDVVQCEQIIWVARFVPKKREPRRRLIAWLGLAGLKID